MYVRVGSRRGSGARAGRGMWVADKHWRACMRGVVQRERGAGACLHGPAERLMPPHPTPRHAACQLPAAAPGRCGRCVRARAHFGRAVTASTAVLAPALAVLGAVGYATCGSDIDKSRPITRRAGGGGCVLSPRPPLPRAAARACTHVVWCVYVCVGGGRGVLPAAMPLHHRTARAGHPLGGCAACACTAASTSCVFPCKHAKR